MANNGKYAGSKLYEDRFGIRTPKTWTELHNLYGITDHSTDSSSYRVWYRLEADHWCEPVDDSNITALYDSEENKFFIKNLFSNPNKTNSWQDIHGYAAKPYLQDSSRYYRISPTDVLESGVFSVAENIEIPVLKFVSPINLPTLYYVHPDHISASLLGWHEKIFLQQHGYLFDENRIKAIYNIGTITRSSTNIGRVQYE